jgi:predicted enzyme involved in methoxymalonyl-ACP biosynthesis
MHRGVEETMLFTAIQHAESVAMKELYAQYIPTDKNKPCLDFWKRSGFDHDEQTTLFSWKFDRPYHGPDHVSIEWA